jgi:hypothetical protein
MILVCVCPECHMVVCRWGTSGTGCASCWTT